MSRAGALAATAVAAGLIALPTASATRLNWKETDRNGKVPVLSFGVTSLTIGRTGWRATVSFGNLSKKTIRVGGQFGVAFFEDAKTTDPADAAELSHATRFSPSRPVSLKPGATWTGAIGGTGPLAINRVSLYARILFGPFSGVSGHASAIDWITDHAATIAPDAAGAPIPTGPHILV